MGRPPLEDSFYGQPHDLYQFNFPWFAETRRQTTAIDGYKLHISVSEPTHDPLAREILPQLRDLETHHKVVLPGQYTNFNVEDHGASAGKFITIYAGPFDVAQHIVDRVDPILVQMRERGAIQPGPHPWSRQSLVRPPLVRTEGGPRQGLLHAPAPRNSLRTERGFLTQREPVFPGPYTSHVSLGRSGMITGLWLPNVRRS